ncbi:SlyX family protein [Mesorhizobium australicum]|uniref:SlyX protein n=1 Tax=Mesorhizobium australicum TaxID=536018 RepID=A0A1X7N9N4_9HYPH|nr:SlyX family protein [Mesorhizobium australicum]SMH34242.1 SlyX protein [Mesorhizobium australicum]
MTVETDERLTSLEVLAAEQERTIHELSAEIGKAWKTIDDLTRRLDAMSLRLTGLEEATAPEIPVTKPPHW